MQLELSHRDARKLFPALIDEELGDGQAEQLRAHLDGCQECRTGWDRYARTVTLVRNVPREKAPPSLATQILRRSRRRRLRKFELALIHHRVPYELLIPILLAAVAAAVVLALGL